MTPLTSDGFVLTYQMYLPGTAAVDFEFEDNLVMLMEYTLTYTGKRTDEKKE